MTCRRNVLKIKSINVFYKRIGYKVPVNIFKSGL